MAQIETIAPKRGSTHTGVDCLCGGVAGALGLVATVGGTP